MLRISSFQLAVLLPLLAIGCNDSSGPKFQPIEPGEFALHRPFAGLDWIVPAPAGHPTPGTCVELQSATLEIGEELTVRISRTFSAGIDASYTDEISGTYGPGIVMEFGTHADTAVHQPGEGAEEAIFVRQHFAGSAECESVRHTLQYRRVPVSEPLESR